MLRKKYLLLISFLLSSFVFMSIKVSAAPSQKRFGGSDRYATSISICENSWDKSDYAVLVSGEGFADALCAASLAKKYNAPVLLTSGKSLSDGIKNQLVRLEVRHLFIIGGIGVVSKDIEKQLDSMKVKYERISGSDRYDTSLKVAQLIGSDNGVVIASGESFPDALSIAPIAAVKGMPILLTNKYALSSGVKQYLQSSKGKSYVTGGIGVIETNITDELNDFKRIGGMDRYETNQKIVEEFSNEINFNSIYISTGEGYADALSGSVAAAKVNSPLILTNGNISITKTAFYSKIPSASEFRVLGGEAVVSKEAVENLLVDKAENSFKLGDDLLISKYSNLIKGKNIGLVTNQTGVNSRGINTVDVLANYGDAKLTALFAPEHGIDGKAKAGDYVKSYTDERLKIPVYSLYGDTRMPTEDMLSKVDVLVFDIQDVGARSYTYISTLNYCMKAAAKYNKEIVVLDRPNPLGGEVLGGPVLEDKFKSFVGIDNMPMTYGMTVGELGQFFNRSISAKLTVVPMEGYNRKMIFQDTGLNWVQSSPYIPNIQSVFCYSSTGLGEGTTVYQDDYFTWVGGKGINSDKFAELLNEASLPGVRFNASPRNGFGGVKLEITDYHTFNPARTGIYVITYAHSLNNFKVPKSKDTIVMFDKIMGTDKIGQYLESGYSPQQIETEYSLGLEQFKAERVKYLIYN
ncbi:exo-beta-N-acetylmuramidase NamZ domain-containing protein [Clostridium thailandense]|uniref:exo-beta-N-acetylmuramidase NamZ domain-containing protein n=1 Tax=Clostridium thailandense TaxID=2794346 RepID=UPI003989B4D9